MQKCNKPQKNIVGKSKTAIVQQGVSYISLCNNDSCFCFIYSNNVTKKMYDTEK